MKRWNYTLFLLAAYMVAFEMWRLLPRRGIVASGLLLTTVLTVVEHQIAARRYFLNGWDRFIHAAVILDIALESCLIPLHDDRGFYFCALALGIVIVGYRRFIGHSTPAASDKPQAPDRCTPANS